MKKTTAEERREVQRGAEEAAIIAADLYTAFLGAPGQPFSKEQAFELTRTVIYDALKDAKIL